MSLILTQCYWWVWLSIRYVRLFAIVQAQMGPKLVSVILCPLLMGFGCIEVYGDTVQTFRSVRYNTSVHY